MSDVSFSTVALSAGISIVTGYAGSLLSLSWQRRQDRRTYGLALMAEVRAIQRGLIDYGHRLDLMLADHFVSPEEQRHIRSVLPYWRHDTSVFTVSSSKIGLFTPALAVAVLEFYARVKWLDTRASRAPGCDGAAEEAQFRRWLTEHRRSIGLAHKQSRSLRRLLRRETPISLQTWFASSHRGRLGRARLALALHRHR